MLNLERNFHAALDFVRDLVEHDADLAAAVDAAADRWLQAQGGIDGSTDNHPS
jgi:hypothetical protein